jgi:hypothetical protein
MYRPPRLGLHTSTEEDEKGGSVYREKMKEDRVRRTSVIQRWKKYDSSCSSSFDLYQNFTE